MPESERTFFEPRFGHDFRHVRVHTDAKAAESARAVNARAFTVGRDVVFGEDQYQPQTNQGKQLLGHELTHIIQQNGVFSQSVIQRKPPTQSAKKAGVTFWYSVEIHSELTSDQLMLEFIKQYYKIKSDEKAKEIRQKGNWHWTKAPLVPTKNDLKKGYILIKVMDLSLSASDTKSQQERKKYFGKFTPEEKDRLNAEVDRQFWDKTHYKVGEKLGDSADDQKMAKYWMALHDEMIRKRQVIEAFPPHIQKFLFDEKAFATLEPKDFDAVLRIASKIAALTPAKLRDYKSRVTAKTTNWSVFELSVDKYIAEMAERAKKGEEHEKIQTKLIGLEEVYKNYKLYKSLLMSGSMGAVSGRYGPGAGAGIAISLQAEKVRKELETQLKKHGFAGITEFEAYIKKFEQAFEQEAANIANDLLEKYAGKLYRESERYKNPTEIAALHRKLGGVRTQYGEFEKNKKILKDYVKAARARERSRIPGQGHLRTRGYTSTTSGEAEAARKKAEEAKASAKSQVKGMSGEHPIFQEEGLPLDKRIDKAALGKASESELEWLLQGHIQNRMKDIGEARAEIHKKPELIYKMDKLLPVFYAKQGIRPGSIHDMIIRDKMRSDAILKLVKGIAVAIVAIALAVLTFGKAIPVIIAVAAGIAGAGLGVYMAYDEYLEYTQEKNLADVGFAKDPSVVWLVIAVLGAAFDMASAVKAVSALGKAAKALDAGGDLKAFTKVVKRMERKKTITAEIAHAADKAALARKGFAEASDELTRAMAGKVYSFPGPLADPKVYRAVVKMARQAIKTKVYDAQKFIDELKLARVKAGLGDLTPEELAKAKQAWDEAQKLIKINLPPPKLSEINVGTFAKKQFPSPDWEYHPLYLKGQPAKKIRGRNPLLSSEPEWYSKTLNTAVEVKRKDFIASLHSVDWNAITRQLEQRIHAMPPGTKNWIVFDIRRQGEAVGLAESISTKLSSKWNEIFFLSDDGTLKIVGKKAIPFP